MPPFSPNEAATEDIVTKYRQSHVLNSRVYQDEEVRKSVLLINLHIKYAVFQGADELAYGLAQMLERAEPLEECHIEDPQGQNLRHIADLILAG